MASFLFDKLNPQQAEAVRIVSGPVMAVAGAGSGKTRVLTNRVAYLIDEIGIPANRILAITFTNRAAEEMRARVFKLINLPLKGIWLSTFHAMGAKILRNDIHHLGYENNFQIIDDDDTVIITKNILKELNYDIKQYSPKTLSNLIEDAKADPIVLEIQSNPFKKILTEVFENYQKFLKANNLVDFQDLLILVLRLFREFPDVLLKYQTWFEYIMVDEFQDTNDLQYDIVHLLAKKHQNLFIVGDEDQSIYAFRGANIENIKKFMRDFPTYHKIILNQNYRSKKIILDAANAVIKHNRNRIPKELFSELGEGEKIIHFKAESDEEEAYFVYNRIKQLSKSGYNFRDMAVLYRNNAMSRKFEDFLLKYNIPYKVIGNISFYKRKEIKDVIAYLHLIVNRTDDYAFSRVYNEPKRGIGMTSFDKIAEYAKSIDGHLIDVIDLDIEGLVGKSTLQKLIEFKTVIDTIRADIENVNLVVTYENLLSQSGYLNALMKEAASGDKMLEAERRMENLQEFKTIILEKIKEFANMTNYEILVQILNELALRSEAEEQILNDEYVSLMTMHSAKGLEFKAVFLTCFEQTLFPSTQSLLERSDVEEERRLFYVALTRAKEKVFITNAKGRYMYGHYQENPDSEFLGEIHEELLDHQGISKNKHTFMPLNGREPRHAPEPVATPTYIPTKNQYSIGDKVKHVTFGEGIIVMIDKDKATIAFKAEYGIKVLMKDHPSIQKI
jgi:DNA helicase II / ATP-dependent DNA helicase PcrA